MNLNEFLDINEEMLDEGLKFFKESKKLNKYADKIESKLYKKQRDNKLSSEDISLTKELLKEIRKASKDFEKLEDKFKFKEITKEDAKIEHAKFKKKYSGMLKDMKSDKVKSLLKKLGITTAVISGVIAVMSLNNPALLFNKVSVAASDFALKP